MKIAGAAALCVAALASVCVPAARADVPAEFVSRPALAARAVFVTAKPVTVLCATNAAVWQTALAQTHEVADVLAFSDAIGGSTISLAPQVCAPLLAKVNGHAVNLHTFGAAVEVLAHESEHIAGSVDEGATECAALAILPRFLRADFGIKNAHTLSLVMVGAWDEHRGAEAFSAAYRGLCG